MYDFDGTEPDSDARLSRPPLALTALEPVRASWEYPVSATLDTVTRARRDADGRPVLVLPGFYATDALTLRLRRHLDRLGYRSHAWGLGRNHGLTEPIVDGVVARLEQVYAEHGRPVSVVGWSFGGLLARWLAHERTAMVRHVVCLGSPWRREGEVTRSTALFERSAREHGLVPQAREIVDTLREPLPVPLTAVWSRSDGIVSWRACIVDAGPRAENVPVLSSHLGLVANPVSLAVVADRLATDGPAGAAFDWARCLRTSVMGGLPLVGSRADRVPA